MTQDKVCLLLVDSSDIIMGYLIFNLFMLKSMINSCSSEDYISRFCCLLKWYVLYVVTYGYEWMHGTWKQISRKPWHKGNFHTIHNETYKIIDIHTYFIRELNFHRLIHEGISLHICWILLDCGRECGASEPDRRRKNRHMVFSTYILPLFGYVCQITLIFMIELWA